MPPWTWVGCSSDGSVLHPVLSVLIFEIKSPFSSWIWTAQDEEGDFYGKSPVYYLGNMRCPYRKRFPRGRFPESRQVSL